ncbi:hypothetical protein CMI47_00320 [Candidatus Pacearchaeota archaeon]|nr:hypothetical protein [Candidatus Pacearchaeota archaeon]|tara:strand:+ start:316 stop:513 length:198 start_codon:yes stop_codon:yes gene_type:complete
MPSEKEESNAWECKCGHLEYSEMPPEDCQSCLRINSFKLCPASELEEKQEEMLMAELPKSEDEDE